MTQENIHNIFKPNKDDMRKHLEFITIGMDDYRDGRIEIAYGNEHNQPSLAESFLPSEIEKMVNFAALKNDNGRNVYLVGGYLNPDSAPFGRASDKDFYACNSIWCDIDAPITAAELRLKYAHCPPSIVVVTGRKPNLRIHLWWKVSEPITNGVELTGILDGIIQTLGGDPATKNPVRLMRLAGSIAWPVPTKKDRVIEQTELKVIGQDRIVTSEQLIAAYPAKIKQTKSTPKPALNLSNRDNPSVSEIEDMLSYIDSGCGRKDWLDIGMALHDAGYDFSVWNDWSEKCAAKYDREISIKDWNSFKSGGGITLGTLIARARDSGYMRASAPPEHPKEDHTPQSEPPNADPSPQSEPKFTGLIADTIYDILAKSTKPQPELATLNVLAALGAVFGRRYRSPMNTRTNLYMVGIAPTGSGKDFSRKYIKSLMFKSGLSTFIGGDSIVSGAGIITAVERNPSQIMHLDEFGMLLADIKSKNTASHMKICAKIFTEFYSASSGVYYGGHYADKKLIPTKIIAPNLCIYGTTTLHNYAEAMDKSVIESGELNRYIIIKPEIEWPASSRGASGDATPSQDLIDAWMILVPSFGANNPHDDATPVTVRWDFQEDRIWAMRQFQDRKVETTPTTGALWVRYVENVIKIAMIAAIARNQQRPYIDAEDLDIAEHLVNKSIMFMEGMAKDNMADSTHEKICNNVLEVIKKFGERIPKRELSNRTRNLTVRERDDALNSLESRGAISIEVEAVGGGQKKYFIIAL